MKRNRILWVTVACMMVLSMLAGCANTAATTVATTTTTAAGTTVATANVDNSLKYIKDKGTLVLGLDDAFPPMGFRDDKNNIVGFDIDVATEVCARLGIKLELQPINWDAKENELNTKKIDCIWNGFSISDERKQNMTFSIAYMDNHMALVVKQNSGIATLADMAGKKLGLQSGSSAQEALDGSKDFKASLGEVIGEKDNMTALMDLEAGGVSAVLMDDVVANYYIKSNNKPFTVLASAALSTEEYAVGFRKGEDALAAAVSEAIQSMAKDGKLNEISQKWFGQDNTKVK